MGKAWYTIVEFHDSFTALELYLNEVKLIYDKLLIPCYADYSIIEVGDTIKYKSKVKVSKIYAKNIY